MRARTPRRPASGGAIPGPWPDNARRCEEGIFLPCLTLLPSLACQQTRAPCLRTSTSFSSSSFRLLPILPSRFFMSSRPCQGEARSRALGISHLAPRAICMGVRRSACRLVMTRALSLIRLSLRLRPATLTGAHVFPAISSICTDWCAVCSVCAGSRSITRRQALRDCDPARLARRRPAAADGDNDATSLAAP